MNWRIPTALVLAICLVPVAQASHFQAYGNYPDGHDELGSSLEPDFRGVTSVLGVAVAERTVDTNLDGRGEATASFTSGRVLAPGCSDNTGRQPAGLCALFTIGAMNGGGTDTQLGFPPRVVGVRGMSGDAVPGLTGTKGTQVRFLDQKAVSDYNIPGLGTTFVDHNRKLSDSTLPTQLRSLDPNFGGETILYSMAHFAWYGRWADRNGNGVIDHLQARNNPSNGQPIENPNNEFAWYGNCKAFDGSFNPGWHCVRESASAPGGTVEMASYIYPGNHHAYCGIVIGGPSGNPTACDKVGIDAPGANLLCLADMMSSSVGGVVARTTARCFTSTPEEIEQNEQQFEGDPIFGNQHHVSADQTYDDRTGDPGWDTRGWYFGLGWGTFYYDQSLVTTTTIITVVNCNESTAAQGYDLATCGFIDVDQYPTWSPTLESLLLGTVKPAARSNWVTVRDLSGPVAGGIDGQVNHQRQDTSQQTGPLNDRVQNPGWSREPNNAGDVYPGAVRGVCTGADAGTRTHNGWCNTYTGYRTVGGRGWADVQLFRSLTYDRAVAVTSSGCQLCVSGPGFSLDDSPENPRAAGDHSRSLGPGGYFFAGASGRWQDRSQVWRENYLDLQVGSPTFGTVQNQFHTNGPDGWVGNVVNATGTFYYRGYANEVCTTDNGPGLRTYAECHPYLDGAVSDPQQAGGVLHGEWTDKACDATSNPGREIEMIPSGGVWTVPILVVRNHAFLQMPNVVTTGQIQDFTGKPGSIFIGIGCFESGGFLGNDFVVLPLGNAGLDITTRLVQRIPQAPPLTGFDTVVDVDTYVRYA